MADATDFQLSTLAYLQQILTRGKTAELESLGIEVEGMRLIRQLAINDVPRTRRSLRVIKRIELDHELLKEVLHQTRRHRDETKTTDQLIVAGAPHRMVNHFFGLTKQDVSDRRKLLDVTSSCGRPQRRPKADRPTEDRVLIDLVAQHIKRHRRENRQVPTNQCRALLKTAELTRTPVQAVWDAVEDAERRGEFAWDD